MRRGRVRNFRSFVSEINHQTAIRAFSREPEAPTFGPGRPLVTGCPPGTQRGSRFPPTAAAPWSGQMPGLLRAPGVEVADPVSAALRLGCSLHRQQTGGNSGGSGRPHVSLSQERGRHFLPEEPGSRRSRPHSSSPQPPLLTTDNFPASRACPRQPSAAGDWTAAGGGARLSTLPAASRGP